MARYKLAPTAEADLQTIAGYYGREAGRLVAANVISSLRSTFQLLADTHGELGRARDEIRPGVRSIPAPPHVVFFRYHGPKIEVVRVFHERQDYLHNFD